MRWLTYLILAYVMVGLQIGLASHMSFGGARPNLVLLAVVFIAINAPYDAALLGSFILGLMQDLTTQQPLGTFAFSYGLAAMFVVSTQQFVYRAHPLTNFSLALIGSLLSNLVILIQSWIRGPHFAPVLLFYSSVYTAVLGILVLGILNRMRRAFAFEYNRHRSRR